MRIHLGLRLLLVLSLSLGVATGVATPAVAAGSAKAGSADQVVLSISGESGDPVTGGATHVWHSGTDDVRVTRGEDGLRITARSADGRSSDLRLASRQGDRLTYGGFFDATPAPTAGHPTLNVAVGDRSCRDGMAGQFRVLDDSPDLHRLWVVFEQRCAGAGGASFGEIRINQDSDRSLLVAPARVEFPTQPMGTGNVTAAVTLINVGSEPISFGAPWVVGRPTKTVLSPVGDDKVGLSGGLSFAVAGNTCTTLPPGGRCVVLVTFRPLAPGPVEASLVLPDSTPAGRHQMSVAGFGA